MKQQKVFLLAGVPGCGKSTWVQKQIDIYGGVWCSRDNVRFSMVKEDEPYFSQEDRVFQSWIDQIQNAINRGENVYIDATHINANSRKKVLRRLQLKGATLCGVNFLIPPEICYERNAQRTGRARVPDSVVSNFINGFHPINATNEGFDEVINIKYEVGD